MRSSLAVGMALALLLPVRSFGQQADPLNGFRNLPGVFVVVDQLDPVTGLTQDQVRRDVEAWIQKGGVRLFTRDQYLNAVGRPALLVTIDALQSPAEQLKDVVLFPVRVALYQNVTLQRLPTLPLAASTWNIDRLGFSSKSMANTFIRTGLQDLIDKFIASFQETNPKGGVAPASPTGAPPPRGQPARPPAAKTSPATPANESKRLVDAARTIAVRQPSGDPDLRSGVEKALELWGRFAIVADPSQADVILEVSTSETKAFATLASPQGLHLWDDVKGVDTKNDKDTGLESGAPTTAAADLQSLGEALVESLQAFVGN